VRVFTLLPAGGSKKRRMLAEGDRGGHTVWHKFTEKSETPQICDSLLLLLYFLVLLRCGSCEDVKRNLVITSVVLKPSPILPRVTRKIQICENIFQENI
jgi:hypothetical protein